jgi:hypothetical protein
MYIGTSPTTKKSKTKPNEAEYRLPCRFGTGAYAPKKAGVARPHSITFVTE